MKRLQSLVALFVGGLILVVSGCASDPNVEGAKLDLRNQDYESALENVNTALERNPENAEALKIKGDIYRQQAAEVKDVDQHSKLIDQMLEAYNQAVKIDPAMQEAVEQAKLRAYINEYKQGGQAFNRGQNDKSAYEDAAVYFENASQIQPDSAAAYTNQAYALLNTGAAEEAIEPLQTAVDMGGDSADNYLYLTQLYNQADRTEETVPLLEEAREKYPDNRDIQSQLLNAYINTGQTEQAMQNYEQAVQREPKNATYRYNYGTLLLNAGQHEQAIEQFSRATEIDPDYTDAQYNLGATHVNWAVDLTDQIQKLDDKLRSQEAELSESEIQELESQIQSLDQERTQHFEAAIPALEKARQLSQAQGEDAQRICEALFSAYVQTGQEEKAQSISECAGYENN